MARGSAPGLTIGQLVLLTLGFLIASVLIFAFGWWVGYDVAQQRLAHEQQVVRLPVIPPSVPPPTAARTAESVPPTATMTMTTQRPSFTPTVPARTATVPPRPTSVALRPSATVAATSAAAPAEEAEATRGWTVQAAATTDPVQAVVLARRLREKGYDAYTATTQISATMWYRVRVGRFRDRTEAKILEIRLKQEEGLEAAFVTPQ